MAVPSLDHEFMQYWSKLTIVQKESLLNVVRNYIAIETETISEKRMQLIEAERQAYLKHEGKTFDWLQVKEMAVNKEKRNGL